MRIAVVCPYDLGRPGGVQDQAANLGRRLVEAGHDAWLVGPGTSGPDGSRLLGSTVGLRGNGSVAPISLDPRVVRRLAEAVAGAEVVHVHEPLQPLVSLGATRSAGAPVVGTFHADASPNMRRLLRVARMPLRAALRRIRIATAVSAVAAESVASLVDPRIVPNGIDLGPWRTGEVDRIPTRVAFVGRDERRKGLDTLLDAWPAVRAAFPAAELVAIGPHRRSVAGVDFLGHVSEDEKRHAMRSSAVFVAPNLGGESFGITVVEGMAAGCAVLASGLRAFVAVAGDGAAYTPPGDAVALASEIVRLLGDAEARARLGERGAVAVERYDWTEVIPAYVECYRDALS